MIGQRVFVIGLLAFGAGCAPKTDAPPSQAAAAQPAPAATDSAASEDTVVTDSLAMDSLPSGEGSEPGGSYIDSVFRAHLGESPRMGWLVGDAFLAARRHARVVVYSAAPSLARLEFRRVIGPGAHAAITRRHYVACEDSSALADYGPSSGARGGELRAFYTSQPPPGPVSVGLIYEPSASADVAAARALLGPFEEDVLSLDSTVTVARGQSYYSLHGVYSKTTKELLLSALILHDTAGRIIGSDITEGDQYECDGCGMPTMQDGLSRLYNVMNGYSFAMFPHPVLLMNTGTIEGRAISLVTFSAAGAHATYRIYEYVVNCILNNDGDD